MIAASEALQANLDKLHRWTFGTEGEFTKDVARELLEQVAEALAAMSPAPLTIDREALSALLLRFLHPPKFAGSSWTFNPDAAADAVIAHLSAQLVEGEVEVTDAQVEAVLSHRWHVPTGRCACGQHFATEKAFTRHALEAAREVQP